MAFTSSCAMKAALLCKVVEPPENQTAIKIGRWPRPVVGRRTFYKMTTRLFKIFNFSHKNSTYIDEIKC